MRAVVPLTLGWVELPRSVSVEGAAPGERLVEPVPAVLLRCESGWLLLDTGYDPALIRDAGLRRRFHADPAIRPILPGPGDPLEQALDAVGVRLDDITAVAVSHLHHDHAGGLRHFAGRVPVHAQRAELAYGLSCGPGPERHGIFRVDFDDPRIDWRLADGEAEVAPGVRAVPTAGHTPGHQSFVVDFDDSVGGGGLVLAFDAADLRENIEEELAIGERVDASAQETVQVIRALKALAGQRRYPLVPGHDPQVWPRFCEEMTARFAPGRTDRR